MSTGRLEAFSDGVMAIIITIMVLELHVPAEPTFHALGQSATGLLTYLLSFVYVGIYWSNHHHFFHLVQRVGGGRRGHVARAGPTVRACCRAAGRLTTAAAGSERTSGQQGRSGHRPRDVRAWSGPDRTRRRTS
jgi:hypothetical protein